MIPVAHNIDEAREHYYAYRIWRYLQSNPGASHDKAYKYARVAWSRKVKKWQLEVTK